MFNLQYDEQKINILTILHYTKCDNFHIFLTMSFLFNFKLMSTLDLFLIQVIINVKIKKIFIRLKINQN